MTVGGPQGFDITLPQHAGVAKALPSHESRSRAKVDCQEIGQEAGMAPIAIGKRVNLHQPMMKAHGDLIGRIT